jgi:hypothetical protein
MRGGDGAGLGIGARVNLELGAWTKGPGPNSLSGAGRWNSGIAESLCLGTRARTMDFERALAGKASCSSVSNRCVASKVVSDDPLRLRLLLSEEQIHRSVRKLNIVQLLERVQKLRQSVYAVVAKCGSQGTLPENRCMMFGKSERKIHCEQEELNTYAFMLPWLG